MFDITSYYRCNELVGSSISSLFSTIIYLLVSFLFDMILNPNISNGIGLLSGAIVNYVGQGIAFQDKKYREYNLRNLSKYMVVEVLVLSLDEGIFVLISNNVTFSTEMIILLSRFAITSVIFIFISYPLRKYWVFHNDYYYVSINTNENDIQMVSVTTMEKSMDIINDIFENTNFENTNFENTNFENTNLDSNQNTNSDSNSDSELVIIKHSDCTKSPISDEEDYDLV